MSADDHLGATVLQSGQGRQRRPDPTVVRDLAVVERNVEVIAHQDAPACHREVIDGLHHESSFDPTLKMAPGGVPDSSASLASPFAWQSEPLAAVSGDFRL